MKVLISFIIVVAIGGVAAGSVDFDEVNTLSTTSLIAVLALLYLAAFCLTVILVMDWPLKGTRGTESLLEVNQAGLWRPLGHNSHDHYR
jgi:hypothetical protein